MIIGAKAIKTFIPKTDVAVQLVWVKSPILRLHRAKDERNLLPEEPVSSTKWLSSSNDAAGLNELAKNHKTIYPCGKMRRVCKNRCAALINKGVLKEDKLSPFSSSHNQTISGLACGKPIRKCRFHRIFVALSELRACFVKTLNLKPNEVIIQRR